MKDVQIIDNVTAFNFRVLIYILRGEVIGNRRLTNCMCPFGGAQRRNTLGLFLN